MSSGMKSLPTDPNFKTGASTLNILPSADTSTASSTSLKLADTPYASASYTGFVSPHTQITPSNIPVSSSSGSYPSTASSTMTAPPIINSPFNTTIPKSSPRSIPKTTIKVADTETKIPDISTARARSYSPPLPSSSHSTPPASQPPSSPPPSSPPPSSLPSAPSLPSSNNYPSVRNTDAGNKLAAKSKESDFEIKDYNGVIANAALENELLNAGYAPLSKIVIQADNNNKRTQYIKAINKKGQKVFILIDVNGYTTARASDLTLIESSKVNVVPYSLKTGAYNCAVNDVCGVAFECGTDGVCVLTRDNQDLSPKEANFVYVEQHTPAAATMESEGSIMTYPVVRLSEIRVNPTLVLANTDTVTRRLRNSTYKALYQELITTHQAILNLNNAFIRFNQMQTTTASKLNKSLTESEQINELYVKNPPLTDEAKDKYRKLQYNLAYRNEAITTLIRSVKKVADTRTDIISITKQINDITDFCDQQFANIEYVIQP